MNVGQRRNETSHRQSAGLAAPSNQSASMQGPIVKLQLNIMVMMIAFAAVGISGEGGRGRGRARLLSGDRMRHLDIQLQQRDGWPGVFFPADKKKKKKTNDVDIVHTSPLDEIPT